MISNRHMFESMEDIGSGIGKMARGVGDSIQNTVIPGIKRAWNGMTNAWDNKGAPGAAAPGRMSAAAPITQALNNPQQNYTGPKNYGSQAFAPPPPTQPAMEIRRGANAQEFATPNNPTGGIKRISNPVNDNQNPNQPRMKQLKGQVQTPVQNLRKGVTLASRGMLKPNNYAGMQQAPDTMGA